MDEIEKVIGRVVVENVSEKLDSIEIGTYQKGGYSRTIKLRRDLSTQEAKDNLIIELKSLDAGLCKDFPTPSESKGGE